MYNRYVRNDNGSYSRIPQEEKRTPQSGSFPSQPEETAAEKEETSNQVAHPATMIPPVSEQKKQTKDGLTGILRHFLDQFHLEQVDTGDLLLLILLFFLFREEADEELLVSLGLLLIL